jgi:hypothetical protein
LYDNRTYICINKPVNAMMNANIVKKGTPAGKMITLLPQEKYGLQNAITGWGKLKATVDAMGVDQNTIKRAIAGFKILPETADKIRTFLNPQQ